MLDEKSAVVPPILPDTPVVLILMGASNLSRGCFALSRFMKVCLYPRKVQVLIATGPGRAYHAFGGLLSVKYPPIESSELFEKAQEQAESGAQIIALVTDIGNDIMYGVPTGELITTLERVFERLQSLHSKIFYTPLPVASEEGIHPLTFYILRTLLFPYSRVPYDTAMAGIIEVNRFLRESACRYGTMIPATEQFLGMDKIHYGWLRGHLAWSHVGKAMLESLGIDVARDITLPGMLQSYWEEFRQVVGVDIMGFKKKKPEHF